MKRKPKLLYYIVRWSLIVGAGMAGAMAVLFFVSALYFESPLYLMLHLLFAFVFTTIGLWFAQLDERLRGLIK